ARPEVAPGPAAARPPLQLHLPGCYDFPREEPMRSHPTVAEVARNFSEFIDRVVHRGERILVMQDRKPVAELRPAGPQGLRLRDLPALLSALPHLSPEDVPAFESDLADARRELDLLPSRDPWES